MPSLIAEPTSTRFLQLSAQRPRRAASTTASALEVVEVCALTPFPRCSPPPPIRPFWLFDLGAVRHVSGCADDFFLLLFSVFFSFSSPFPFLCGPRNGEPSRTQAASGPPIHGVGAARIRCRLPGGSTCIAESTHALYGDELHRARLLSRRSVRDGYELPAEEDDFCPITSWKARTRGTLHQPALSWSQ